VKVSVENDNWLVVEFGSGYVAKTLGGAHAIIDLSRSVLPAAIELVSIVDWAARCHGETIAVPSIQDLGSDTWCLRYDRSVDCLMVYLYPDHRALGPFRNREVAAILSVDYGGSICGVAVRLEHSQIVAVMRRLGRG